MTKIKILALASSVAALAVCGLAGNPRPAAAQDAGLAAAPRAVPAYGAPHRRVRARDGMRPLTVTRRDVPPPFIEPAAPRPLAGVSAIAAAPFVAASQIADAPFRALNGLFPAVGDPAQNPLVLVGLPIRTAGELVQVPFRIVEAPIYGIGSTAF